MPQATRTTAARTGAAPARTDRTGARLVLLVSALVLAQLGGFALGRSTGGSRAAAVGDPAPVGAGAAHTHEPGAADHSHDQGAPAATAASTVGGLAVSAAGFTLVPVGTSVRAGVATPLRFTVNGADGQPVTRFAIVHDRAMHLIVVRRDLTGYQHLHPVMAPDGTWSVDLRLPAAGSWRAYADFTALDPAGTPQAATLGVDLTAAGDYRPVALPPPATTAAAAGFSVAYEGAPRVGATSPLLFRVTRDGAPVPLEPYLGAYGHLVMLREGDLGYVHVHPEPRLAGDAVKFWLTAPSPGRYRLFLDFQVAGVVHTAGFTTTVG